MTDESAAYEQAKGYPSRDAIERWVPGGSWALTRGQALAMHAEIDRLTRENAALRKAGWALEEEVDCWCADPLEQTCTSCHASADWTALNVPSPTGPDHD